MDKDFFAGKKVLVMGLGRFGGGVDTVKFACKAGAKVKVTDRASAEQLNHSIDQLKDFNGIEYRLGEHKPEDFTQADIIVVNPAVTPDNEFVKLGAANGKFVTSAMNIFFELCPALIIGITGANGKSTTAALTAHLLKAALGQNDFKYSNVWLSGNIGNEPLLWEIEKIAADDIVVLEISSFQTEQLAQIKKGPKIALLTNLTPNHLDRHGSFTDYCTAKENIFKFQRSSLPLNVPAVSIFNSEDEIAARWFEKYKSDKNRICIKFSSDDIIEEIRKQFPLPGRANLSNLAAAIAVATGLGIQQTSIKDCISAFTSLPHRLELVANINGVRWYNDSIATTPESAIAAIDAFAEPIIIIAGGYDKNLDFGKLGKKIAQKAKAAVLIGQTAEKIANAIRNYSKTHPKIQFAASLAQAVSAAKKLTVAGDIVLLTPACASYDMFDNFLARGEQFSRLVNQKNKEL